MSLDRDIRLILEEIIDNFLKDKVEIEKSISVSLKAQGIEPNLETVLSMITGAFWGLTTGLYAYKHKREMSDDERLELIQLMKRKAWELRQAFLETRVTKL